MCSNRSLFFRPVANDDPKKCNFNFKKLSKSHSVCVADALFLFPSINLQNDAHFFFAWKWITCELLALFLSAFGASCLALQFLRNYYAIYTFRNAKEFRIACLHILTVRCGCGKNRVYQNGNEQTNERGEQTSEWALGTRDTENSTGQLTVCCRIVQPRKMSIANISQ